MLLYLDFPKLDSYSILSKAESP